MMRRATWTRLAAGGLVCGCLGWLLYVPYAPRRLLSVIPPGAAAVTSHYDLAGRWDDLAANPLGRRLLERLGGEGGSARDLSRMLPWVGTKDLLLANVPGDGGEPFWVLSAWIGARSHAARWWLRLRGDPRVERVDRRWWRTVTPLADGRRVYFALEEGILIGCLASGEDALAGLINGFHRRRPSLRDAWDERDIEWLLDPAREDRFWIQAGYRDGVPPDALRGELSGVSPTAARLVLLSDTPIPQGGPVPGPWQELHRLHGAAARAVLAGTGQSLRALSAWLAPGTAGRLADALCRRAGPRAAALILVGGEYGGRLNGLRVPALAFCIDISDQAQPVAWMQELLKHIRRALDIHLVLTPSGEGGAPLYTVDPAAAGRYAQLDPSERAAVALVGPWLVVSSSRQSLDRLLERQAWTPDGNGLAAAEWVHTGEHEGDILLSGWSDLRRTGKSVGNLLAVRNLVSMQSGTFSREEMMERIEQTKSWIRCVQELESARLQALRRENGAEFRLQVGKEP